MVGAQQTRSLRASESHLKEQQEELQQINEELEEKSELLTRHNIEVAQKHQEVEQARQALEEKAEQLALTSKYKSEFLANMSHELRTPLNSLLILSQQLADNPDANLTEKQVRFSQTIHGAGTDLLTLINDILDLAKIESGSVTLEVREVRFSDLHNDLLRTFQPIADNKQVAFTVDLDAQLPRTITTDDTRLQQILKNLLSNAFKFTSHGQVSLRISPATAGWKPEITTLATASRVLSFTIQDTGIGIPADKQKVIFEAFQQADGSTSRRYGGTGLGLTISRELTMLLGGDLSLTSSASGEGSTFTLFLPIADLGVPISEGAFPHSALTTPRLKAPQSPIRTPRLLEVADDRDTLQPEDRVLLIIEDDANFARILLERAKQVGFKGLVALEGMQGLTFAQQFKPAAITLDLNLPDVNGWVVLDRLKVDSTTRHIPVHIISADAEQERGLQQGAFAYLTKPTSREALEAAFSRIGHFLERRVRHLLVVEDDDAQRQSILELVGNGDVIGTAVGSGGEALTLLDTQSFDCMVLDLRLPDMSGFQLLAEMQRKPHLQTLPVIIYTGKELTHNEERQLQRFTQTIIIKDVRSPERLLDETALFLHRVASNLPEPKRRIIERLHQTDSILAGKKILIVDDDVRNLFALTALLERHQIEVVTVESGVAALQALETTSDIQAVLMDIMMPDMDGYEATRTIRQQPQWRTLPIIALTAKAMKGDREKCIEAGASDYISKPVNNEQLLSLLRVWLYR
ncbi:MAG: response regulator [Deltaproteobacteria bacterium]|nr:response regulator [Deltaproteobacteria bacterium]